MEINTGNLRTLGTGFSAAFRGGLGMAPPQHLEIASVVPSSTGKNEYGWLNQVRGMREWLGDRVLNQISQSDYTIKNKDWEDTIEVERNDIEDDNLGQYGMLFTEMGRAAAAHPCELVFALMKAGFTTPCYDGQYYFDTDHPVLDANGNVTSVANTDGGAGAPWFLIDVSRVLKPIIFQERKKVQFITKDNPNDENVFWRKKFVYGADARYNVGFGFWQFAWGSKQPLTAANYAAARAALMGMKGDYGRPLGLLTGAKPLLLCAPSLESAALKIVNNELGADGETNEWKDTARVLPSAWLA
ncbi:Mu-like prophage major head subunit gpT family protein [Sphingobium sp. WTD-1]|uniref:Mu-like prophage major head subunit gpT family protein n=1 Tax=Sphingobium sp. WTD-1 TaxID=2979467 RepID=UPI0024DE096F|nr:Mu-like prophage major head subunit gpT family protein [Sphingobium sp. WTD-1]WIA55481.1 Mu-like prophage major head subunit gpT family protein [Sphingobium sp. WTD-1]